MTDARDPNSARALPQTGMDHRRRSDERKRQAGYVRLHSWVKAERLGDLDTLMDTWSFSGRAEAVDVAIRYLVQQSRSLGATLDI